VCKISNKEFKHDFVKNISIIPVKFQLILKLDSFYFFSTEHQCFEAQWVLWCHRQLGSV